MPSSHSWPLGRLRLRPLVPPPRLRSGALLFASALLLGAVSACSIPELRPPQRAKHPLVSNQPLVADVPTLDQRVWSRTKEDCEVWPLDGRYTVTVSAEKVCVSASRIHMFYEQEQTPGKASVLLATEEGPVAYIDLLMDDDPKVIARCTEYTVKREVHRLNFSGCVPNEGLVTKATRKIAIKPDAVDQAIWVLE